MLFLTSRFQVPWKVRLEWATSLSGIYSLAGWTFREFRLAPSTSELRPAYDTDHLHIMGGGSKPDDGGFSDKIDLHAVACGRQGVLNVQWSNFLIEMNQHAD